MVDINQIKLKKNLNILLLSTPTMQKLYTHPYSSIPVLSGQLKKAGYNTLCKDLYIDFFYDLFSLDLLNSSYKKIKENFKTYTPDFYEKAKSSGHFSNFELNSIEYKIKVYSKYKKGNLIENLYNKLKENAENNSFLYNDKLYQNAIFFNFLPYIFDKSYFSQNYNFIKSFSTDKNNNFFFDYFSQKICNFSKNYDLIMVSKLPDNHVFYFFTLCKLLKEHYKNSKIAIGGSIFSFAKDSILKYPEIFDIFCDYIIIGNGENAVVEIAEYINGKRPINKVSNLLYKTNDNKIHENSEFSKIDINKTAYADYDDYDFSKYNPENPTISLFLSKGCYWGKCNFCSYSPEKSKMQLKKITTSINEIQYYIKKYGIKQLDIVDDAIIPAYYKKLSEAIIKNNIKVDIQSFAMFDKGFTPDILAKMKQAGVFYLIFGLETHSKKVFKIANKGGDFEHRAEILKNVHNSGIFAHVNVIEGLPGENLEDLIQTIKFLYDNSEYITRYTFCNFYLGSICRFVQNPEMYNLKIKQKEDFEYRYPYEKIDCDITKENSFLNFQSEYIEKNYDKFVKEGIPLFTRRFLQEVSYEYLKKFAPEML